MGCRERSREKKSIAKFEPAARSGRNIHSKEPDLTTNSRKVHQVRLHGCVLSITPYRIPVRFQPRSTPRCYVQASRRARGVTREEGRAAPQSQATPAVAPTAAPAAAAAEASQKVRPTIPPETPPRRQRRPRRLLRHRRSGPHQNGVTGAGGATVTTRPPVSPAVDTAVAPCRLCAPPPLPRFSSLPTCWLSRADASAGDYSLERWPPAFSTPSLFPLATKDRRGALHHHYERASVPPGAASMTKPSPPGRAGRPAVPGRGHSLAQGALTSPAPFSRYPVLPAADQWRGAPQQGTRACAGWMGRARGGEGCQSSAVNGGRAGAGRGCVDRFP